MKSILVPTEAIQTLRSTLETAVLLARRCNSYIEGFPLRFGFSELIAMDPAGSISLESYRQDGVEEAKKAQELFEAFMREHDVPPAVEERNGFSYRWNADAPEGDNFVGNYGRVFDVTVLGRPDDTTPGLHHRAIESGLFESGRPIVLAPPAAPQRIATNIMIHWNGSTEQARTNAFALPLLRTAEHVTVLTVVGGQRVPGPSAEQLINYLKRNGIAAKPMRVEIGGRSTGETVLATARDEGCDLLVKGAFTQSRLRQMIFGGTTSHILANAQLPVLMAH